MGLLCHLDNPLKIPKRLTIVSGNTNYSLHILPCYVQGKIPIDLNRLQIRSYTVHQIKNSSTSGKETYQVFSSRIQFKIPSVSEEVLFPHFLFSLVLFKDRKRGFTYKVLNNLLNSNQFPLGRYNFFHPHLQ